MKAVPPRRGQRIKSLILPPFNGGLAFTLVKVDTEGGERHGILQRRGKHASHVWLDYDIRPTMVSNDTITAIALPSAPSIAYTEFEAVIGGVGKHVR